MFSFLEEENKLKIIYLKLPTSAVIRQVPICGGSFISKLYSSSRKPV